MDTHNHMIETWARHRMGGTACDRARREFYLRPRYVDSKFRQVLASADERRRVLRASRTFLRYLFRRTDAELPAS